MDEREMTFDSVKSRLEEIVDEVNAEGLSLDEALSLYEEAVKLGLAACDLSEQDALEAASALEEREGDSVAQDSASTASAPARDEGASSQAENAL